MQILISAANDSISTVIAWCCFCQWNKLAHLVKLECSMWEKAEHIHNSEHDSLQWWHYKGDNRPPPTCHIHTIECGTKMQFPCKFWAHLQKDFHIQCDFDSNLLFTLLNLLIYLYIYTFFFPPFAPSFCLFLMCWLNAGFVHWAECTGTGLLYPSVLVALFIHVTSCPFASSSSVLRRGTDALDSRHIWVAQALIVCQPLRQHH